MPSRRRALRHPTAQATTFPMPRPRAGRGMAHGSLPVPDLLAAHGVTLMAAGARARDLAGWRLYVYIDGAPLVDGQALATLARQPPGAPFRAADQQIVVLTPREEPVEVDVGVEWGGRGRPSRLPRGMTVTVHWVW